MNTFLFYMLLVIIGFTLLLGVFMVFIVDIIRSKKSIYSMFILCFLFLFLG